MIRPYTPADKASVLQLLRLNTPDYFGFEEEPEFIHYLEHELDYYYVIETGGDIIGCGGINMLPEEQTGRISWDMLHPAHQGKGLGRQLLGYRIDQLQQMKEIHKIIVRTSQLAYRFYEKGGFRLIQRVPDFWAKGYDLYLMEYEGPASNNAEAGSQEQQS